VFRQEATTVFLGERSSESPFVTVESTEIEELHLEQVAGLGGRDFNRTRKVVDLRQVDILNVVRAIIILDLTSCPVYAIDTEDLA
jgi:hypothetical protein